jgi:hypothetical protein
MISIKEDFLRIEGVVAIGLAAYKLIFDVLRPSKSGPTLLVSAFIIFGIYIIAATKAWSERLLAIVLVADMALKIFVLPTFSAEATRYSGMLFAGIYFAIALFYWSKAGNPSSEV